MPIDLVLNNYLAELEADNERLRVALRAFLEVIPRPQSWCYDEWIAAWEALGEPALNVDSDSKEKA